MATNNPYATYQHNSVNTSTPGELTLMLYNGCLKFIHQAKNSLENNNFQEMNLSSQKAQAIISELMLTLDTSYPVSQNMLSLYEFVNSRLIDGNIKKMVRCSRKHLLSLQIFGIHGSKLFKLTVKNNTGK